MRRTPLQQHIRLTARLPSNCVLIIIIIIIIIVVVVVVVTVHGKPVKFLESGHLHCPEKFRIITLKAYVYFRAFC